MKLEITEKEAIELYKKGILKEKLEECYPELKKKFVKKWEELKSISGYYIDIHNKFSQVTITGTHSININVSPSKQLLKSQLAEIQLAQILYDYYGENTEDWLDWKNEEQEKYYVYYDYCYEELTIFSVNSSRSLHLYFKTAEDARKSAKLHRNLWLQYFGIKNEKEK